MNSTSHSLLSSPFSTPNVSALLKIKILSWSQETGFPLCIRVRIADRIFNLHKHPLASKSGYFREKLRESNDVELPPNFPGGAETFQMIALFIYGSSTLVDPFNVASLRCAAEFLEMKDEYAPGNLCQRFDIYLNQVVLQSWDDTLIVLQKCQTLLPLAEELLIVSRCIETLAFMACMEILDPERRRDRPVITLDALACRSWIDVTMKDVFRHELWIKDLVALPLPFFERIIGSLRRQGMKEKYVSPIIIFYADRWVLFGKCVLSDNLMDNRTILQGIIKLLPMGLKGGTGIPVGFYFSMLAVSLEQGFRIESMEKLQNQIASVLHLAQIEDLLLIKGAETELLIIESIFSTYFSLNMESDHTPLANNYMVAELWDTYLYQMASDPELGFERFMSLIETVPNYSRQTHDQLYRALDTFFQCNPQLSQEEKENMCKYLSCQKLSQEVCIEAVQNELMPMRFIVQALFIQQLNTQQAFKECSDSFRYTHCGEYSGSISSSRYANSKSQNLGESPFIKGERASRPLSFLLQRDSSTRRPDNVSSEISKSDYESTSFRIENLEHELLSLKKSLQSQKISKKNDTFSGKVEPVSDNYQSIRQYCLAEKRTSKKKNEIEIGQVTGCIGTVSFGTQRKYATKILKLLRRISIFGRGRSKRSMRTK